MRLADIAISHKMAPATARPAAGSTHAAPSAAPIPAATTAREVNASVRAWRPSVIRASEPIAFPTVMRYRAGNRGHRVGRIVQRVRKQRHRTAEHDDHRLDGSGDAKDEQRHLRGSNPHRPGIHKTTGTIPVIMAMTQQGTHSMGETTQPRTILSSFIVGIVAGTHVRNQRQYLGSAT